MYDPLITQCILSLGSNHHASQNLATAHTLLLENFADFSDVQHDNLCLSPILASDDKNPSQPNTYAPLSYLNQIAWVTFSKPILLSRYTAFTKLLEHQSHRHAHARPIVTLDIDILAIKLFCPFIMTENRPITAGSVSFIPLIAVADSNYVNLANKYYKCPYWYGLSRRMPFPNYDNYGINYLLTHNKTVHRAFLPLLTL